MHYYYLEGNGTTYAVAITVGGGVQKVIKTGLADEATAAAWVSYLNGSATVPS